MLDMSSQCMWEIDLVVICWDLAPMAINESDGLATSLLDPDNSTSSLALAYGCLCIVISINSGPYPSWLCRVFSDTQNTVDLGI
jgi:hypothetical protein